MCDKSFLPEGEADDLDFSLDLFASDLFAFAFASAALSLPLDLLRPRLPLSLLLPFSLLPWFGRLTKSGTAPRARTVCHGLQLPVAMR